MTRHVVRVVLFPHDRQGNEVLLLDPLRYAGLITVHPTSGNGYTFDISPPPSVTDTEKWARINAKRIGLLGLNAEACPATQGVGGSPPLS